MAHTFKYDSELINSIYDNLLPDEYKYNAINERHLLTLFKKHQISNPNDYMDNYIMLYIYQGMNNVENNPVYSVNIENPALTTSAVTFNNEKDVIFFYAEQSGEDKEVNSDGNYKIFKYKILIVKTEAVRDEKIMTVDNGGYKEILYDIKDVKKDNYCLKISSLYRPDDKKVKIVIIGKEDGENKES
jgi:hypothetical protein